MSQTIKMKGAVRIKYGPPESLKIQELPKPIHGDNDLLIRVHAATVSRTDCHNLIGKPWIMPLVLGFPKPRLSITGTDFAGQVEAIGKKVQHFKAGDRVMGFRFEGLQSHAEYISIAQTKDLYICGSYCSCPADDQCILPWLRFYFIDAVDCVKCTFDTSHGLFVT